MSTSTAKVKEETKQIVKDGEIAEAASDEEEDEKNAIDEVLVSKGLGNALKVLRDRGLLGKQMTRGRNMDRTMNDQL